MEKTTVTLEDVREAAERIRPYIRRTPLLREKTMDKDLGCQIYLKPEMLQLTGAFKPSRCLEQDIGFDPGGTEEGNHHKLLR